MDTLIRWLRQLTEHPQLSELYYRGIHDFESLEGADLVRFGTLLTQLFHIYDEIYYQQLEGHLDPRVWRVAEAPMRDINAYPGVKPGGVYARIGSMRILRSILISYSRQLSLRGCFVNQLRTNDANLSLQPAGLRFLMHVYEVRPRKDKRGFDLISDALPFRCRLGGL